MAPPVAVGPTLFRWTGPSRPDEQVTEYQLVISPSADFAAPALKITGLQSNFVVLGEDALQRLAGHPEKLLAGYCGKLFRGKRRMRGRPRALW